MKSWLPIWLFILLFQTALISYPRASGALPIETFLFDPRDGTRDRVIPIKVYVPKEEKNRMPIILFSHGLGGSREASSYLGQYWANAGYVAVFVQHPGSDEGVWKDAPVNKRLDALKQAVNVQALLGRIQDISFTINQLEYLNQEKGHPLSGRLNLQKIGMSGHSFGAVTTQAVMGQKFLGNLDYREKRLKVFLLCSPSVGQGLSPENAFGHITSPVMCMTGTEDHSPIRGAVTAESRRKVFASLPMGDKFQLVFYGGHHDAFSERDMNGREARDPRFHSAIQQLSTAFWDAYLKDNDKQKGYLKSDGPKAVLLKEDIWEWK
ncbi:MAG: acetylhydrolase [Deltaproteobacteria bacterium]|nr:acetylhydrolase [Deltaproteobacteria bacterium]